MNDASENNHPAQPALKGPLPEEKPPWVKTRIIAAPKIRQTYWCDFWRDSQLPEMWKTRPVVVVSYRNKLSGPCLVIPTSTEPQGDNRWAWKLSASLDGQVSWAICNQPSTIATSRLSQVKGQIPLVSKEDFNEILKRLLEWLPVPFESGG